MKPCTRVGLDITWRCNWRCSHCFYRDEHNPNHCRAADVPLADVLAKIDEAVVQGYDHAVMTGFGEPTLCKNLHAIMRHSHQCGLATSIISNGSTGVDTAARLYDLGLNHLHLSRHGVDGVLNEVAGNPKAQDRQDELVAWLAANRLPYRTNVSLQHANCTQLSELARDGIEHGVRHFVFLGFLPHYEWHGDAGERIRATAVHPAELRPHIEAAADLLLEAGVLFTIRYHPFCHLRPDLWKHVTNARHVYFDPWEWNYTMNVRDVPRLWRDAVGLGDSVACAHPCGDCLMQRHCGGWNRHYAAAYEGAGLAPIRDVPSEYLGAWEVDGGVFNLNPANSQSGTIHRQE